MCVTGNRNYVNTTSFLMCIVRIIFYDYDNFYFEFGTGAGEKKTEHL